MLLGKKIVECDKIVYYVEIQSVEAVVAVDVIRQWWRWVWGGDGFGYSPL